MNKTIMNQKMNRIFERSKKEKLTKLKNKSKVFKNKKIDIEILTQGRQWTVDGVIGGGVSPVAIRGPSIGHIHLFRVALRLSIFCLSLAHARSRCSDGRWCPSLLLPQKFKTQMDVYSAMMRPHVIWRGATEANPATDGWHDRVLGQRSRLKECQRMGGARNNTQRDRIRDGIECGGLRSPWQDRPCWPTLQ